MKTILLFLFVAFISSSIKDIINTGIKDNASKVPYFVDIKSNIHNLRTFKLSGLAKEIQYIPLETNSQSLLAEIDKVEICESYIFVSEIKKLLQFDRQGNFIRQIGSAGRGPEEYLSVTDFSIDIEKKEIYIISLNKLTIFGFNGQFKKSFKIPFGAAQLILKDPNSIMYHLFNVPGISNMPVSSWVITNRQGEVLYQFKNSLARKNKPGLIIKKTPLYIFDNSIRFMEFGTDTLYYFKGSQKTPYAIINLGNLKMDPDPLITTAKKVKELSTKLFINSVFEDQKNIYIGLNWGLTDSLTCIVFNKNTSETNVLKDNAFLNDLDGSHSFWPKQMTNDNILISYKDAYDFLKYPVPTKLKRKLNVTSNPVLIILK